MYEFRREVFVPAPQQALFDFFSEPSNLARITPRSVGFRDLTPDAGPMRPGMNIVHEIRWFRIPMRWRTVIEEYEPPHRFVDVQIKGPYKGWRHEHTFDEAPGGTLLRDHVQYELPFGPIGAITHALMVRRQLRRIFDYRERAVLGIFAKRQAAA
jgi:ligand-binding SRPBCC domain-containing protein